MKLYILPLLGSQVIAFTFDVVIDDTIVKALVSAIASVLTTYLMNRKKTK